jgi:hypothetical protein
MEHTMNLLRHVVSVSETLLLPIAAALLFEELTLGGLVRLLLAPRPSQVKQTERTRTNGELKCSH